MTTPHDTEQLLQRARRGDAEAGEQLLALHRGRLVRLVAVRLDRPAGSPHRRLRRGAGGACGGGPSLPGLCAPGARDRRLRRPLTADLATWAGWVDRPALRGPGEATSEGWAGAVAAGAGWSRLPGGLTADPGTWVVWVIFPGLVG
jgi:hypothetical protein